MDGYAPDRVAVAEAWVPDAYRLARYVRPGELHQAFNFTLLSAPWSGPEYREVIDTSLVAMGAVGAPPTWVLSNHDVLRHATRLGPTAQPEVGLARARAATLLLLALPGSVYLYQGEELGLPEVLDLPPEARQDPIFARTEGALLGRDGCRVPLPWAGTSQPYGFGPPGSRPWLPQPSSWARLSVEAQDADPGSTLAYYRQALRVRRALAPAEAIRWDSAPDDDVLVLQRSGLRCMVNMGTTSVPLPPGSVLIASGPLPAAELPPNCAVWQDPAA
jgi:alpha-glucosidase